MSNYDKTLPLRRLVAVLFVVTLLCSHLVSSQELSRLPDPNTLVVLGEPSDSALLDRLPFSAMSGETLLATLRSPAVLKVFEGMNVKGETEDSLLVRASRVAVDEAAGVYVNFSHFTAADVRANPLLGAAFEVGVPIVLENVADPQAMGEIMGLGLSTSPGEVLVVQSAGVNRAIALHVSRQPVTDPDQGEAKAGSEEVDPDDDAALISEILRDHAFLPQSASSTSDGYASKTSDCFQTLCPPDSCYSWIFTGTDGTLGENELSHSWTKRGQTMSFSIRFVITLHDSLNPAYKSLSFLTCGHAATGGMADDDRYDRGYFIENVDVSTELVNFYDRSTGNYYPDYVPAEDLSILITAPSNIDTKSNLTINESVSVGGSSSGDVSASYTAGWSLQRPLKDFKLENQTQGATGLAGIAKWRFQLGAHTGGKYDNWKDLENVGWITCTVHNLGEIAENNLQPTTLSVWAVERSFRNWAKFKLGFRQDMRKVFAYNFVTSLLLPVCRYGGWSISGQDSEQIWVNFDRVHRQEKCEVEYQHWIGDGYCDKRGNYNTAACGWDGGDCCRSSCRNAKYTCGIMGYDCKDPNGS